ncbi:Transcriptional regulator SlyA [Sporomusa silvacetica DSM 10669]|uniref:Transcriptional regulator SlyA n=1 Tax=Sporomusa silvacetica DSM 10669 TaxID=1123289 RepID=A0ABZ3IQD2_9FIRM|nr:MarR family winged helix-turn-helix transcriptional regulator [Sporomusa silvacetica]OZC22868.1 putative HTH-type transcriptional regulator YusO [Sporomusa silvacetica DSM 10669]
MSSDDKTEHLYTLIHKITRKLRNPKFDSTDQKILPPITKVQWWILKTVWEQKQCTAGYLAKKIGVRPSTMSQMLDRLEKADFIVRFTDAVDARVRIIRLTDNGQNMFYHAESKFVEKLVGPFECLTPEEQQFLILLLEKLARNFPQQSNN